MPLNKQLMDNPRRLIKYGVFKYLTLKFVRGNQNQIQLLSACISNLNSLYKRNYLPYMILHNIIPLDFALFKHVVSTSNHAITLRQKTRLVN